MIAPRLAELFPKISGYATFMGVVESARDVVRGHVNRHRQEMSDEDEKARDFMEAYLKEIDSTIDPSSSFYKDAGSKP